MYASGHRTRINRSKRNLVVSNENTKTRVPIESIDAVVLIGAATMTLDAIGSCVDRGVRVAVLKRSGALRWTAGPPVTGNVALRRMQHQSTTHDSARLEVCRHLVGGKLQNSYRMVRRWARDSSSRELRRRLESKADLIATRLERVQSAHTENHVRGIEGDAARSYFAALGSVVETAGWHFTNRNRRPPRDPVNALLSFGYGLLATELTGALEAVGLDPQFGYLHRDRSGRPALALDVMEEFRVLADRVTVSALRRHQLKPEHFTLTPGGGTYLSKQGRSSFFAIWENHKNSAMAHRVLDREVERWALPGVQATLMARYIRGDIPVYPPFVIQG